MDKHKGQDGAAALVASIVIATVILSISLSLLLVSLNVKSGLRSYVGSVQSFYSAESGVGESLMQLRKEPNNFVFGDVTVGGITASSQFVEQPGECEPVPECQFLPGEGWWAEYFNYSVTHPDMEVNPYPGPTPTPTEHDWYDDTYKTHEQIDAALEFDLDTFFPYDGTIYEDREGFAHDYFFGMHWRAKVTAPVAGDYGFSLSSDDDSWLLRNGIVTVNNSGTHDANAYIGDIYLTAGDGNIIDLYFADRHSTDAGFDFHFDDTTLVITPWPEGCGDDTECNSNIQATASSTYAGRKAQYTCSQDISGCFWSELVP